MEQRVTPWPCPYCNLTFATRKDIQLHLQSNKQSIIQLLAQLGKLLTTPSCAGPLISRSTPIQSYTVDRSQEIDLAYSTNISNQTTQHLRCPSSACVGKPPFSKRNHLLRHYKSHVSCDVRCDCGSIFNRVDYLEKHLTKCQYSSHRRAIGLKKQANGSVLDQLRKEERGKRPSSEDEMPEGGPRKKKRQLSLPDPQRERQSVQTKFSNYGAHRTNSGRDETLAGTQSFLPTSTRFSESYLERTSSTFADSQIQLREPEKPDNPHVLRYRDEDGDVTRPVHLAQDFWRSHPSTGKRNGCPGGVQRPQTFSSDADHPPASTFDWDLLYSDSRAEGVIGQSHFESNVDGGSTAFTGGELSFNVLATEDFDNLWSEFHART